MGDKIEIKGFGKLLPATDAGAPLLIVFGGKAVDGRTSGDYMWDFMDDIEGKYHIFVANNQWVKGKEAYEALMKMMETKGLTASTQILYLFSGGWNPGIHVLRSEGAKTFSAIFLVDIWMNKDEDSGKASAKFYQTLADTDGDKLTYIYTPKGAVNAKARDYIANKLGAKKSQKVDYQEGVDDMDTHMSTNKVAVGFLK